MNVEQPLPIVTVIITNWRRPRNIPVIVEGLEEQTIRPVIQLVDNAPQRHPMGAMMDRIAIFPFGSSSYGRVILSFFADTEWICLLSDDLVPGDKKFLEDAINIAKGYPEAITGARGRLFDSQGNHRPAYGKVQIIGGHFMLFRKKLLEKVRLYFDGAHGDPEVRHRCDDIYLSMEIGRGKPVHWADIGLYKRLKDLPHGGAGMGKEGLPHAHLKIRKEILLAYAKEMAL